MKGSDYYLPKLGLGDPMLLQQAQELAIAGQNSLQLQVPSGALNLGGQPVQPQQVAAQ